MAYWFKSALSEMKWFRRAYSNLCNSMSSCEIIVNDMFVGAIYISEVLISYHWYIGNNLHVCNVSRIKR